MVRPCNEFIVLDFSWGMAGSLATAVLADFGAEVVKIEPPSGDPFRSHPAWLAWNRGKKSVVLNLKTAEGREQAERLGAQSPAVVRADRQHPVRRHERILPSPAGHRDEA